jgi:hypothetical protein
MYTYFPSTITPFIRVPEGHPEGFHEAMANLHRCLEWQIRAKLGEDAPEHMHLPGIADGVAGMAFIEAAVRSAQQEGAWVDVEPVD